VSLLADGVSPSWLALREPADAWARSRDLVTQATSSLTTASRRSGTVVHDLACGTGSMLRWLAPQLPGPQRWVLHDVDGDLLDCAVTSALSASRPAALAVEARRGDVTRLPAGPLAGADLVTASALLDLLTEEEVERLAVSCLEPGCPVLLTLTVTGAARLDPPHPLDGVLAGAFARHQRRPRDGRRLLGPDAAGVAASTFTRLGATVEVRPAPWRLGPADAELILHWFDGWLSAACRQEPDVAGPVAGYARARRRDVTAGRLNVVVDHEDLLVVHGG
jgi:hypothetical protein